MKNLMTAVLVMIGFSSSAQEAFGEVQGYLVDKSTRETVPFIHVFIKDMDRMYQVMSDDNGMFRISAIPSGTYMLNIRYEGDTLKMPSVQVKMNSITQLGDIELEPITSLDSLIIRAPLRLIGIDLPVAQLDAEDIKRNVSRLDTKGMILGMTPEVRMADDGSLVFRGARKGDMIYMIDGIKANDIVRVPSAAMNSIMVYTGALPAKYGDTLGGVVVVETKSYFDLYRAWMAGR